MSAVPKKPFSAPASKNERISEVFLPNGFFFQFYD